MEAHESARSQFTLREILFATALTFLGMTVLNSVTFTDNPALGCAVALIATILGGLATLKLSTPNTTDRFYAMAVLYVFATVAVLLVVTIAPQIRPGEIVRFLLAVLLIFGLPIGIGLFIAVRLFPADSFLDHERWKRITAVLLTTVFIASIGIVVIFDQFLITRCGCSNQTAAAAACRAYAEAQEIYHRTDYDGDGVLEYAQSMFGDNSLLEQKAGAGDILMIDPAFAEAAWEHPNRQPKAGYYFKVLRAGGCATGSYIDEAGNQTNGFAILAVPAVYDGTGRDSFLIDKKGTIYQKDLGPDTLKIAESITDFQIDDSWVPTE